MQCSHLLAFDWFWDLDWYQVGRIMSKHDQLCMYQLLFSTFVWWHRRSKISRQTRRADCNCVAVTCLWDYCWSWDSDWDQVDLIMSNPDQPCINFLFSTFVWWHRGSKISRHTRRADCNCVAVALGDTANFKKNEYFLWMNIQDFKKMNIFFEWIFGILKKWIIFLNEYSGF